MIPAAADPRAHVLPIVAVPSLLLVALLAVPAFAQGTGRSLDIQPGARQNGLGAAGVALAGDPSDALWWNPAALGFTDRTSGQFNYAKLVPGLADVPYYHVATAAPLGSFGGFGTSFTYLNYNSLSSLRADEASPALAVGVRVHPALSIGGTLKWIRIALSPQATDETLAGDIGIQMRLDREPWKLGFGFVYQNFGGEISFLNNVPSPLSRNYKVGASVEVPMKITPEIAVGGVAVLDFNQSDVTSEFHTWSGGIEGYLTHRDRLHLAIRSGYHYDPLGDIQDFTFGGGVRAWMIALDAASIPQARNSDLDRVVKLTAGVHIDL